MKDIQSLLLLHEGERLKPYRCTAGKLSIGVGRNLDDTGISHEESLYLLANDIRRAEQDVLRSFAWAKGLDPVRFAALIDMCFNLGISRLRGFKKFLAALAVSDWQGAAIEMMDSAWARQVGQRAFRLRNMVLTGLWPDK